MAYKSASYYLTLILFVRRNSSLHLFTFTLIIPFPSISLILLRITFWLIFPWSTFALLFPWFYFVYLLRQSFPRLFLPFYFHDLASYTFIVNPFLVYLCTFISLILFRILSLPIFPLSTFAFIFPWSCFVSLLCRSFLGPSLPFYFVILFRIVYVLCQSIPSYLFPSISFILLRILSLSILT